MSKFSYEVDEIIYEKQLNINNINFKKFAHDSYILLKEKHILEGIYKQSDINNGIIYEPGSYLECYNILNYYSIELYQLLNNIKLMLINACIDYGINIKEQNYMIHAWLNYLNIDNFSGNLKNNLPWHDHGKRKNAFHGYYCINAEPSVTHYKINKKIVNRENKNGKLVLAKTGIPHAVGRWNGNEPRITLAYNIARLEDIIYTKNNEGKVEPFIPLT